MSNVAETNFPFGSEHHSYLVKSQMYPSTQDFQLKSISEQIIPDKIRSSEHLCTGSDVSMINDQRRIKSKNFYSTEICSPDTIKIAIYMEAVKVFRGKGVDRRFADYLDCLGRYLSSDKILRSNTDVATNGVEWILQSFLTTKKLKKLHNLFVKSLLKQCYRTKVSKTRFIDQIPMQWQDKVKVDVPLNNLTKNIRRKLPDNVTRDIQSSYGCKSSLWTANGWIRIEPNLSSTAVDCHDNRSPRIPGTLEINHIAENLLSNKEYCLSESAIWAISIAIKEHLLVIMRNVLNCCEDRNDKKSKTRRSISTYQIMQIIHEKMERSEIAVSELAWEQLALNTYQPFSFDSSCITNEFPDGIIDVSKVDQI